MSEIDTFKHRCLGKINFKEANSYIPIYQLLQNVGKQKYRSFYGNKGDILIGGGSGELPALRINVPVAYTFYGDDPFIAEPDEIVEAFWSMNRAYEFIKEYIEIGYNPREDAAIEFWLMEHVLAFLLKEYPEDFSQFVKENNLELDGSICSLFTEEEKKEVTWVEIPKTKN